MSRPYDLIVFDWEGTIADTLGIILHAVTLKAQSMGLPPFDPALARQYVDLGLTQALNKIYPNLSLHQQEQLIDSVQQALHTRSPEICLIPGVREFIELLDQTQVHLAVATNKGSQSLTRALTSTGLDKLIKVTRAAGQTPAKPCPQMLEEIMDEFAVSPERVLMIGDSPTDIEMARNIQVDAIGVDFYHQNEEALHKAGALAVFDDYQVLANFLHLKSDKE